MKKAIKIILNVFVGFLVAAGIVSLLLHFVVTPLVFDDDVESYFKDIRYNTLSIFDDSPWKEQAVEKCEKYLNDLDKIYCVYDYFEERFEYVTPPNTTTDELDENFKGNCVSATLFYMGVFKELGRTSSIEAREINTGAINSLDEWRHVYVDVSYYDEVTQRGGYCSIDQKMIECREMQV